jgi:hypothetical protein
MSKGTSKISERGLPVAFIPKTYQQIDNILFCVIAKEQVTYFERRVVCLDHWIARKR